MWLRRSAVMGGLCFALLASIPVAATDNDPAGMPSIVVPRATIYPGDRLEAGLLDTRPVSSAASSYTNTVFSSSEELEGMVARRTLLQGRPIPRDAVRPVPVVRQGEPVSISYRSGGIHIELSATALQSGGVGETISVRNADTGRVIADAYRQTSPCSWHHHETPALRVFACPGRHFLSRSGPV